MRRHLTTSCVIGLICLLASNFSAFAQGEGPLVVGAENNETSKTNLDHLALTAGKDKIIILIGRLGVRERSRALNRKRLHVARGYLENVRNLPRARVVIAEGEKVSGDGRIEVYLDNRLFMIFMFERNKNFAKEP